MAPPAKMEKITIPFRSRDLDLLSGKLMGAPTRALRRGGVPGKLIGALTKVDRQAY